MTPQENNDALERLSTKGNLGQAAECAMWLLFFLGLSITLAYFLVYGEPRFDRIHSEFGVPPAVSEIALWCVALMFYVFAIVSAWSLKRELKARSLGHKCALLVAVLLTAPVGLLVLLIGVPFLWERLNSMPNEVWLIIGFLIWHKLAEEANQKKFVTVVNMLRELQQSVRNIEKEKTEPRAKWGE
jgi:hypothetical protein